MNLKANKLFTKEAWKKSKIKRIRNKLEKIIYNKLEL